MPSPHAAYVQHPCTEVDLVLPPLLAFYAPGMSLSILFKLILMFSISEAMLPIPPFLGQGSAYWAAIFSKIKQLELLWDAWKPSKTLDQMTISGMWDCYNTGEAVLNSEGMPTGMKPPLRLVEQYFKSDWWKGSAVSSPLTEMPCNLSDMPVT
ncbi:hypothetical protein Hypma_012342 [Hypsizygus marmoreus]|uniref:Uncharacterized protein n=1 Tax=Hypsizygus marmoreus TaxID=39966 RepID=A0A369K6B4_HYPMA|nr:hypothetical protein Hypma_012342 [Hypsizygus marmoreus]